MNVEILWANLHTVEQTTMDNMQRRAAECEEAGGRVRWLQSSTVVVTGQMHAAGVLSASEFTVTPITALTCILTWKGDSVP